MTPTRRHYRVRDHRRRHQRRRQWQSSYLVVEPDQRPRRFASLRSGDTWVDAFKWLLLGFGLLGLFVRPGEGLVMLFGAAVLHLLQRH